MSETEKPVGFYWLDRFRSRSDEYCVVVLDKSQTEIRKVGRSRKRGSYVREWRAGSGEELLAIMQENGWEPNGNVGELCESKVHLRRC